jgi:hypothetical protein
LLPATQYFEIHYEQIVQEPESSLQQVCDFLGETYHSTMLSFNTLAKQVGPGPDYHTEVMKPVFTASVGRWRSQMSNFEIKITDRIAGSLLNELAYEDPENLPFTFFEIILFYLLAIKYFLSETLRQILYRLGVLTLNRNMRQSSQT